MSFDTMEAEKDGIEIGLERHRNRVRRKLSPIIARLYTIEVARHHLGTMFETIKALEAVSKKPHTRKRRA